MIEYALLIMLGFFVGGLIAFLLAPTIWHRAVRLTTKRLEATMPMSLSEIEADKDLLRASYAIRIRRLEAGLNKARDKSANQLVNISKLQMEIAELNQKIAVLNAELEERNNAANVFESTIRKRFPELENMVAMAEAALNDRKIEIADLSNKLSRREETLTMVQRSANLQQEEIARLRDALEKSGSDTTGRFKRRPSQWTLNDYRSEYDRLNAELSKMREQLVLAHEREKRQIAVLKTELQHLAERIMSSVPAGKSQNPNWREDEGGGLTSDRSTIRNRSASSMPVSKTAQSAPKPPAWRESRTMAPAPASTKPAAATGAISASSAQATERPDQVQAANASLRSRSLSVEKKGDIEEAAGTADRDRNDEQNTQDQLKSLLKRSTRFAGEHDEKPDPTEPSVDIAAASPTVTDQQTSREKPASDNSLDKSSDKNVNTGPGSQEPNSASETENKAEPKLDQVFREILEGSPSPQAAASPVTPSQTGDQASAQSGDAAVVENAKTASRPASETATQTLVDRLRVMQDRQTG